MHHDIKKRASSSALDATEFPLGRSAEDSNKIKMWANVGHAVRKSWIAMCPVEILLGLECSNRPG